MKIILLFTISMLHIAVVFGQEMFEWTEASAVTDSNSFNSNPFVWVNGYDISVMFYEKKTDENTHSMIYQTELNGDNTEFPLLNDPAVNYRQPVFLGAGNAVRAGFLFYLADPDGKFALFATEYLKDGSLDKTYLVASEESSIEKFGISDYNYWVGWNSGGSIYVGNIGSLNDTIYFNDIQKLDSVSCSNVVVGIQLAAWEKQVGDSISIKYSRNEYNPDIQEAEWITPVEIDRLGNEPTLSIDHSVWEEQFNVLSWADQDHLKSYDLYDEETINYESYGLSAPRNPSGFYWYMAVKSWLPEFFYLTFDAGDADSREIYSLQTNWGWGDTVRITNNDVEDTNPDLFSGETTWPEYSEYVYCIWQSLRNGKAPLYMSKSKAEVGSGLDENKARAIHIQVSPNPFSLATQIAFKPKSNSVASLSIYSGDGRLIETKNIESTPEYRQIYNWHPSAELPKGVYIVTIAQDGLQSSTKVIYR